MTELTRLTVARRKITEIINDRVEVISAYDHIPTGPEDLPLIFNVLEGHRMITTGGGTIDYNIKLYAVFSLGDAEELQECVDSLCSGPTNLSTMFLEDYSTLDGTCDSFTVGDGRSEDLVVLGVDQVFAYSWECQLRLKEGIIGV